MQRIKDLGQKDPEEMWQLKGKTPLFMPMRLIAWEQKVQLGQQKMRSLNVTGESE